MIGRLTGTLADKNPPQLLVDCNGVGYEVDVPMSTFYNLPGVGEKVSLLTHFVVREDAQILYGFGSAAEREAFMARYKAAAGFAIETLNAAPPTIAPGAKARWLCVSGPCRGRTACEP